MRQGTGLKQTEAAQGLCLSHAELLELTGYELPAWQRRWLDARQWVYTQDRNGRPKVLRAYMEGRLGLRAAMPTAPVTTAPAFDRIR
ncbi:MAG: DUF4224 domain-containing protein [Gammaproteobacteria bacterium]|nr:DUF4224 domain-containing protein [Gammaproteobacteria bacterium]